MVFSITCLAEVEERNQTCENGEWSDCGAIAFPNPTRTIPYPAGVLSAPVGGSSLDSAGVSLSLREGGEGGKGTGGRRLVDREPGGGGGKESDWRGGGDQEPDFGMFTI